jgi:uncharacterized protein YjbI with pentapeptide repeats
LNGADLTGADLTGANLSAAILDDANLTRTWLIVGALTPEQARVARNVEKIGWVRVMSHPDPDRVSSDNEDPEPV